MISVAKILAAAPANQCSASKVCIKCITVDLDWRVQAEDGWFYEKDYTVLRMFALLLREAAT